MHNFTNKEVLNWRAFLYLKGQLSKDSRLQHFYNQGTYHEDTAINDIEFVALDFETTGLDASKNSIISIGLVHFNLQRIFCRTSKSWYIDPQDNLQEDSIVIHGITHSDLNKAPDLLHILEELLDELAGKVIVVHYRPIERNFLDSNLHALINEGIIFPVIDTMQIEADVLRKKPKDMLSRLKGSPTQSIRLANTRIRYNLPAYSPHSALTDAIATAELFQAQVKYHFTEATKIKELWL